MMLLSRKKRASRSLGRGKGGTYDKILDAAASLFIERGYDGTSVGAIAKIVGVGSSALYNHFKSKDEILMTLLSEAIKELAKTLRSAIAGASKTPPDLLRAFAQAHSGFELDMLQAMPKRDTNFFVAEQLENSLPSEKREFLQIARQRTVNMLDKILAEGVEQGVFDIESVRLSSLSIFGLSEQIVHWYDHEKSPQKDFIVKQYGNYALRLAGAH